MGECDGKIAFVTGASRGIGRAIAYRFAAEGAAVVVCASRMGSHGDLQGNLEETVSTIQANGGGQLRLLATCLTRPPEWAWLNAPPIFSAPSTSWSTMPPGRT
jgi:NAD(P)-dependent dehydrogenase (short-subunit alcohol dehydrogenase family)